MSIFNRSLMRAATTALTFLGGTSTAFAINVQTCAEINGSNVLTANYYGVSVTMAAGETLWVTSTNNPATAYDEAGTTNMEIGKSLCGPKWGAGTSCTGANYTAEVDGSVTVEMQYTSPFPDPGYPVGAYAEFSCGVGGPGGDSGNSADAGAAIGGSAQASAVGSALGSQAGARAGGSSLNVTRSNMFLSTAGHMDTASNWSGWLSISTRHFDGDYDGHSYDLIVGADTLVGSSTAVGGFVALGKLDLEDAGGDYEAEAVTFGPYFMSQLSDTMDLRGYLGFGSPNVEAEGSSFSSDRVLAGLTLSGHFERGRAKISPFFDLTGFREKLPTYTGNSGLVDAHTVSSFAGALGVRVDYTTSSSLRPYFSLAGEYHCFDDGQGTQENFTSARVGAGFLMQGKVGELSVGIDAGKVTDGTRDIGGSIGWRVQF